MFLQGSRRSLALDLSNLKLRVVLLSSRRLEIDEQSVPDAQNSHVVAKLLLLARSQVARHSLQFDDDSLLSKVHDQVGITLADAVVTECQFDHFLTFVLDACKPQRDLHSPVVNVLGEARPEAL